jgi:hypothetical protein
MIALGAVAAIRLALLRERGRWRWTNAASPTGAHVPSGANGEPEA